MQDQLDETERSLPPQTFETWLDDVAEMKARRDRGEKLFPLFVFPEVENISPATTNELPPVEIPRKPAAPSEGIRILTENPWRLR